LQAKPVSAPLLVVILGALAMIGPFSVDTYLPSFPSIARDFAATPLELQQTLSVYLVAFAVMTLFHGALSDSFGRRPVILGCLLVYTIASIGCATAQSYGQLLMFRGMQGLAGGAGWVIGRAIVRDAFEGHHAQRMLAMVTMVFGLAPALAPIIGGWLQATSGWRGVFAFLVLYGATMLAVSWFKLPETHPVAARQPFELRPLAANYLKLSRNPLMVLLCLTAAFNFSGLFLFIAAAPAIIYDLLGLTEHHFSALFVPTVAGIMFGAYLSGRFAGRVSPRRTVAAGFAVLLAAVAINAGYHALYPPALPWSVVPVVVYAVGMALSGPSIQLLVLDLFPANRGLASSLQGFTHTVCTALTAGVFASLLSVSGLALALGQGAMLALAWLCWLAYRRLAVQDGTAATAT
jgi:DHA1 family bicyclomycin/chloramphenicol resistance-like MFS transporter